MKYFENLFIRSKLLLCFGLIWFMLLVVIIVAYLNIREITQSEKYLHDVNHKTALKLQELRANENITRAALLEMLLTQNRSEQIIIEKGIDERSAMNDSIINFVSGLDPDFQFYA
jgi:hypothetical protein